MSENEGQFQPITFPSEYERIVDNIATLAPQGIGLSQTGETFHVRVTGSDSQRVNLEVLGSPTYVFGTGDWLEVLFTFDDGRYLWKTGIVESKSAAKNAKGLALSRHGGQMSRLQRRENFRTTVPYSFRITFRMLGFKNQSVSKTTATLLDLSAGGVRLRWPSTGLVEPQLDDKVSGVLETGNGRDIEVFGRVKNLLRDSKGLQVGLEFESLSGRDEQVLLSLCLQMRRYQVEAT